MSKKKSIDTIGNWTLDFPACTAVHQPTALRWVLQMREMRNFYSILEVICQGKEPYEKLAVQDGKNNILSKKQSSYRPGVAQRVPGI